MRLKRFNESGVSGNEEVNWLFFKAVYPDLQEDVKEYLDTIFIDFIDKGYQCNITKVNIRSSLTFFTRYKINMTYQTDEKPDRKLKMRRSEQEKNDKVKFNTIENYSEIMSKVSEDLLNLNSCVMHVRDEYSDESIYGNEFPINVFDTSVNMNMESGELSVEFILDIR